LGLLLVVCLKRLAPLGYLRLTLLELLELYDPHLVGINEATLLPEEPLDVAIELLLLGLLFALIRVGTGELLELCQESLGVSQQPFYVLPGNYSGW